MERTYPVFTRMPDEKLGDTGLCCVRVTSFERRLSPFVDSVFKASNRPEYGCACIAYCQKFSI